MPLLTPEDYVRFPTVEADYRYPYGSHPQQFGELTLPRTAPPHPVIVLIHGGCYRELYDLRPLGIMAVALADAGFAVWNIEYRRHGNGGGFPQMFHDVAAAADFLCQVAETHSLDLSQVISMGHSAGGHLALWLAGRHRIEPASPLFRSNPLTIRAVLALAPLADIRQAISKNSCGDALPSVMGGDPDAVPTHFRNASPSELLPLGVPQTIIVGSEDTEILENVSAYVNAAIELDDEPSLILLPGAGHFELVSVEAAAWDDVCSAISRLRRNVSP